MATPLVEPLAAAPAMAPALPPEVAPIDAAAPPVAPTEEAAPTEETPLTDEILQMPAFQGLLAGQPVAVSVIIKEFSKRPEGDILQANKAALPASGIGLYRSIAGDLGVLFNQAYISGEEIKTADKDGTLAELAPSFDAVNQQLSASGDANPILNAQPPTGVKPSGAPSILPPVASTEAPPAGPMAPPTPQKAIGAKMRNLAMGSPTSGPAPGQGRILNSILKPVL